MKQRLSILAILLMALGLPQVARAYQFTSVSPSGHTLCYDIVNNSYAQLVWQYNPRTWYQTNVKYNSGYRNLNGDVIIPDSVTNNDTTWAVKSIGSRAFERCSTMTSISLPPTLTELSIGAFRECSSLATAYFRGSVEEWLNVRIADGEAHPSHQTRNLYIDGQPLTSLVVPEGVRAVNKLSFYRCECLTSVSFPSTLDTIYQSAFEGCGITELTLPHTLKAMVVNAFARCSNLTNVNYNCDSLNRLGAGYWDGSRVFAECNNLSTVNVGSEVSVLPHDIFRELPALTTVTFAGNKVKTIGNAVFYADSALTNIVLPSAVETIGNDAFRQCVSITQVSLSEALIAIGNDAFRGSGITSITIPQNVNSIGRGAFCGINSLTSVYYNVDSMYICSDNTWGGSYFTDCPNLTSIVIGNNVRCIPATLFTDCKAITELTIPESCRYIRGHAFYGCTSLVNVNLPDSIIDIGWHAFSDCSSIQNLIVPDSAKNIAGAFDHILNVIYHGRANLDTYWEHAYYINKYAENDIVYSSEAKDTIVGCRPSMTSISIPEGVTVIADNAFSKYEFMLTDVTIPPTVTGIGARAFADRYLISSIDVPSSVDTIGDCAFSGIPNINYTGSFEHNRPWCALNINSPVEDSIYYQDSTKTVVIGGHKSIHNLVIPAKVTTITNEAFRNCDNLKNVTFHTGLQTIGDKAFYDCDMLTSVVLPDSIFEIGAEAFRHCDSLKTVTFPRNCDSRWGVSDDYNYYSEALSLLIGGDAFRECTNLEQVNIYPQEGKILFRTNSSNYWDNPGSTFRDCEKLQEISGMEAFYSLVPGMYSGCRSLRHVAITNNISEIPEDAFSGCSNLTSAVLSEKVTKIGNNAFNGCSSLGIAFVPSATAIGDGAFAFSGIMAAAFPGEVEMNASSVFQGCYNIQLFTTHVSYHTEFDYDCWCDKKVFNDNPQNFKAVDGVLYQIRAPRPTENWWDDPVWGVDTNILSVFPRARTMDAFRIPDGVEAIAEHAFNGVNGVKTLIVPASMKTIENRAFTSYNYDSPYGYSWGESLNIDTVEMLCSAPELGSEALQGIDRQRVFIKIPCGTRDSYYNGEWGEFSNYSERSAWTYSFTSSNNNWGNIDVISEACSNEGLGLWANASTGYHFANWNDGNSDNPRYKMLDADWTVVAIFAPDTFTVTLASDNTSKGFAIGAGRFVYNSIASIGAVPAFGNKFVRWNDGSTDNPRQITVDHDYSLSAIFEEHLDTIHFTDTLRLVDTLFVDVQVPYAVHDTTTVYLRDTLITNSYQFDTSIYNHFRFDTTLVFDTMIVNVYSFDTSIYNNYQFDTLVFNTYRYDTTIVNVFDTTLHNYYQYDTTIINNYGYQFDTSIYNHFRFDTTLVFDTMIVNVYSFDTSIYNNYQFDTLVFNTYQYDTTLVNIYDTVINNIYQYDTTIINNYGYQFDTSIYNHFRFDTTLVFDTMIVNVYSFDTSIYNNYQFDTLVFNTYRYDTTLVNVFDTVIYNVYQYDTTLVYDTTIVNIYDTTINNLYQYDTVIVNNYHYDTVYVNSYTHDTVNNYFYDTVNNYYYDTVIITHTYHDTVIVNNYIYDTVYVHDTVFVPAGTEGIGNVETLDAKIYQRGGSIVVESGDGYSQLPTVTVFDAVGRQLRYASNATTAPAYQYRFDVPASGTYLVKIGDRPARRIVVIK